MKKIICQNVFLTISLVLFLLPVAVSSQNSSNLNITIKGVVLDSVSKEKIPYTTISLSLQETPSVYVKRIASDVNGNFELTANKAGNYILSVEAVGMKKKSQNLTVSVDQKIINVEKIYMSPSNTNLTEVTVTASKPLVKVDLDKISYDVKSDPEATSFSVLDMLKKVPLVTVDTDDKIRLKGSTNYKIFMNSKETGMLTNNPSQVLKSMPATSVKRIEIITDPGAKYDAEGVGGIINIITDRSINGLTGSVSSSINTKGGKDAGLYLSTKKGKFGLTTNLNYSTQNDKDQTYDRSLTNYNPGEVKYIHQYANSDAKFKFYYGDLEASYEFDSLNLVSLTIGGYGGGNSSIDDAGTYSRSESNDTISAFKQLTKSNNSWGGMDLSIDYQHTFKKPEQMFTVSYKLYHVPDKTDNTSDLTGVKNYTSYKQHIMYNANSDEHTFQIDYTEPFNKIHVLDVGLKYIIRLNNSVNNYYLLNKTTNNWYPMPNQPKNNLNQTQNILGAYASYVLKLDKFSARAGIRFEKTSSNISVSDTSFQVIFGNVVPSVTLGYKLNEANNIKLSYNQRISRPGIWYMNPYIDNSNPLSISQGNTDLVPEISNSFSLSYNFISSKFTLNTSLYTYFTNNSIERVSKALNDTVTFNTYKNIGLSQSEAIAVYGNWQLNKSIRLDLNGYLGYSSMTTEDGSGLKNNGFNYSVSLDGEFTLPYDIKLSAYGGYYSRRINLQGHSGDMIYSGLSLSRDFLNKKLNISLSARNPFTERRTYFGFTQTATYMEEQIQSYKAQSFGLSVTYRFGELKEQIKKVSNSIQNDDLKGGGRGSNN